MQVHGQKLSVPLIKISNLCYSDFEVLAPAAELVPGGLQRPARGAPRRETVENIQGFILCKITGFRNPGSGGLYLKRRDIFKRL